MSLKCLLINDDYYRNRRYYVKHNCKSLYSYTPSGSELSIKFRIAANKSETHSIIESCR